MIDDRDARERTPAHAVALDCIEDAIRGAAPETAVQCALTVSGQTLSIGESEYELDAYDEILVVGGGKAAGGMTQGLEAMLGDRIAGGLVVSETPVETTHVDVVVGDHPLPSETNIGATESLLELVDAADEQTLVLFVLTGGASALLSSPANGLSLPDLQAMTERLLDGGVSIEGINAVRKHCSNVKGGRLARRAAPADVVGLLVSDVVGDDPSTIGSGPTVPDDTTFADARAVLDQYDIDPPEAVSVHLTAGVDGRVKETPFPGEETFHTVQNVLIGDNGTALDAARTVAEDAGYEAMLLSSRLHGEAREVGKTLVAIAEEVVTTGNPVEPPAVLLGGGETTVTVTEDGGNGGPNQELVLSAALGLDDPVILAAVDTDGHDGSSDAAGAIADETTVTDHARAHTHLAANDAGTYLREVDALIETGPTGTNVNDVVVLVIPEDAG